LYPAKRVLAWADTASPCSGLSPRVRTVLADIRRAVVRTLSPRGSVGPAAETLRFADLELCTRTRLVARAGRQIDLTPIEFDLLELFMRHPDEVLERSTIAEHVWGFVDFARLSNSMTVYIGYLRRKTERSGAPRLIHTVRGVGYVLREA
jgi:two-component system response regulator MprA